MSKPPSRLKNVYVEREVLASKTGEVDGRLNTCSSSGQLGQLDSYGIGAPKRLFHERSVLRLDDREEQCI